MSSSAYDSVLKNLGGGFRTRNPSYIARSRSGASREDAAEFAATVDRAPIVENVDNTGNPNIVNKVADIGGPERIPKKRKLV